MASFRENLCDITNCVLSNMKHCGQSNYAPFVKNISVNGFGGEGIAEQYGSQDSEEMGKISLFSSGLGYSQENVPEQRFVSTYHLLSSNADFGDQDDLLVDIVSPPIEPCKQDIANFEILSKKHEQDTYHLTSLELLKKYRSRRFTTFSRYDDELSGRNLSTIEIIRLAGEIFIQSCSQTAVNDFSVTSYPSATGLSDEQTRGAELINHLLHSANCVGKQEFDRASNLVNICDKLSSSKGNTVQRLVSCFCRALREKINLETRRIASKSFGKKQSLYLEESLMNISPSIVAFHQKVPFSSVCQFTAMQTIIDHVTEAKKVHIVDLEIRNGMQYTFLMQALVHSRDCPLEHLKVTAIGTKSKSVVEKTGEWLMSFAQSISLPFYFNVVMISDMADLNEDLFELDTEEAVAVYSPHVLSTIISRPGQLECLVKVIRKIKPCVMVITEVEANHNSPVYVKRFTEALFFYGALFDSVEDCMDRNDPNRMILESIYFGLAISNILATDGEERIIRHVNSNVWKTFFSKFGAVETELSKTSLYQSSLLIQKFACANSCTLEMMGKSLTIGWKGVPIFCVSAFKFL